MQTQPPARRVSFRGTIVASMMLIPAFVFSVLQWIASPDLETWLKHQTGGFFRNDAFEFVERISPLFTVLLATTSVLGMYFVLTHRSNYLLPLSAGPSLMAVSYLATNGIAEPNWFELLALTSIGMLVGTPITIAWSLWAAYQSSNLRQ